MSGKRDDLVQRAFVLVEDVENLQLQITRMLERVKNELEAAQNQYDEYPEKGAGSYMKAIGKLEGLEEAKRVVSNLLENQK